MLPTARTKSRSFSQCEQPRRLDSTDHHAVLDVRRHHQDRPGLHQAARSCPRAVGRSGRARPEHSRRQQPDQSGGHLSSVRLPIRNENRSVHASARPPLCSAPSDFSDVQAPYDNVTTGRVWTSSMHRAHPLRCLGTRRDPVPRAPVVTGRQTREQSETRFATKHPIGVPAELEELARSGQEFGWVRTGASTKGLGSVDR